MQDCRTTRWGDQNPVCRGRPGEEPERNCVLRNGGYGYNYAQAPANATSSFAAPVANAASSSAAPVANASATFGAPAAPANATSLTTALPICNGTNGTPGQDCRAASLATRKAATGIQICNGTNSNNCIEPEQLDQQLVALTMENGSTYVVTCNDRQQEDCQPVCTETLTTGCTEARTPIWPSADRFEGKYTFK